MLSRRIVDFSVERSFAQTEQALREHYRIDVPRYTIDKVTAQVCREAKAHNSNKPETVTAAEVLVSEVDGSMLPIINTEPPKGATNQDRRKHRKCHWKEIRVSTVSNPKLADTYYGVALGEPLVIGFMMLECCQFRGMTPETHVHAVSDGARWIADQYELHFGTQCKFLLDIFHACDYLAAAAQSTRMSADERKLWLGQCKESLKKSRAKEVIKALEKLNPEWAEESDHPVAIAIKYLGKREEKGQLDYAAAIEGNLPIGSGEVESAHRHILQKRLKIPGAWWRLERAEEMAQLRALRANNRWDELWQQKAA
jgi:hypothetical protein